MFIDFINTDFENRRNINKLKLKKKVDAHQFI